MMMMRIYMLIYCQLAFPADIGRKPASLAQGSQQRLGLPSGKSRFHLWHVHAG